MRQRALLAIVFFIAMSTVRALIERLVSENKVMLFTKSYCPYCIKAKQLFTGLNVTFGDVELDKTNDGSAIQNELLAMTGQKTVPSIFISGKHVGGCDSVHKLHEEGKLLPMVDA